MMPSISTRNIEKALEGKSREELSPLMKLISLFDDGPSMKLLIGKIDEKKEFIKDPLTLELLDIFQDAAQEGIDLTEIVIHFQKYARLDQVIAPMEKIKQGAENRLKDLAKYRVYVTEPEASLLEKTFKAHRTNLIRSKVLPGEDRAVSGAGIDHCQEVKKTTSIWRQVRFAVGNFLAVVLFPIILGVLFYKHLATQQE